jgi:FKBP-type peptidyl-prolyl cis-trans isomerase SlyD
VKISKDTVVAIEYTIRNQDGEVVDTSEGRRPLEYIHGYKQIVPGVEEALAGMEAGRMMEIAVTPDEAYGARDPSAVLVLPRKAFPDGEELDAGSMFRAFRADGRPIVFSIIEANDDVVIVDANHPLAGQTLQVAVEVLSVREATDDEVEHGHVHSVEASQVGDLA